MFVTRMINVRIFRCGTCERRFVSKAALRTHIEEQHTKPKAFICGKPVPDSRVKGTMKPCGVAFANQRSLNLHIESVHCAQKGGQYKMKFLLFLFGCNSFTNYECVFIFNFTLQHFPAHGLHRVVRSSSMPRGMLQIMAEDVAKILTPPSTTASPPVGKSSSRYYKQLRTLTLRIRTLQLGIRTLIMRNTNIVLFVRLVPSTSTKGRHMGQQVDLDQNQWSLWRTHHLKIANTKKEVSISLLTPPTHCFDCFVQYIFDITYFLFSIPAFPCPHGDCGKLFKTKRGATEHGKRCPHNQEDPQHSCDKCTKKFHSVRIRTLMIRIRTFNFVLRTFTLRITNIHMYLVIVAGKGSQPSSEESS